MTDRRAEGVALGNLGTAYGRLGEAGKAIDYFEQRLAIAREIGDRSGELAVLGNIGAANFLLGKTQIAIDHFEQQLIIAREIGDRRVEGSALANLGQAFTDSDPAKARACLRLALEILTAIEDTNANQVSKWLAEFN